MPGDLESQVWQLAQETCDVETFEALLNHAVDSFKRAPGYDPLVRLHASDIGQSGLKILGLVLRSRETRLTSRTDLLGYLELRSCLKDHLRRQLQSHLLQAGLATDEMKSDQLDRDLGL